MLGVTAFAAFRLAELTRYSLWYDELFSVTLAQMDWRDLFRAAVTDRTNPPLFYALLKVWISIGGESVAWMRMLPCSLGILAAVPIAALARRTFEPLDIVATAAGPTDTPMALRPLIATAVTLAAAAASPLLVLLANEIRGYSLLLLLTTTSLLAFARLAQARGEYRRRLVILAAVNALLVYTHYFGWLVVAAEVGAAAFWQRRALRGVLVGALASGAAFAPWILTVFTSASRASQPLSNVSWISRPSLGAIPGFYDSLVARVLTIPLAWVGVVLLAVPLVWLLASAAVGLGGPTAAIHRGRPHTVAPLRAGVAGLIWFAVFPVLVVFVFSLATGRSAFVPRYLVVAAPAWWMLVGLAVTRLPGLKASVARLSAVAGGWCAFTLAAGTLRMVRGNEKIAWHEVVAAIAADAGGAGARVGAAGAAAGTVYSLEGFTALPLSYYAHALGAPLTVRPIRPAAFAGVRPPAWLVVREETTTGTGTVVAALAAGGIQASVIRRDSIPSQRIAVLRLDKGPP